MSEEIKQKDNLLLSNQEKLDNLASMKEKEQIASKNELFLLKNQLQTAKQETAQVRIIMHACSHYMMT